MTDLRDAAASPAAGTAVPPATFPGLFDAQVRRTPGATAVECAGESWTYEELNARANRIAHWLIGRGTGSEDVVAVAMPRCADQIAVLLGILKAGAAYLPWDLGYPPERIAHMRDDAAPVMVLTTRAVVRQLPAGPDTDVVPVDAPSTAAAWQAASTVDPDDVDRRAPLRPAHAAYVIYTSGSTGRPKGVTVTHGGLAALRVEALRAGGLDGRTSGARVLQFASLSFDMSVWDLVLGLTTGAALVVPPRDRLIGADLAEVLATHGVTHATLPPSVLATLPPGTAGTLDRLRVLVIGGEACTPGLVTEWGPGRTFVNAYGPTESTVWATFSDPLADGAVPIGTAMTDTRVYVLDERLEPVVDGQAGELYLAGAGLARGYLGRWALTAARFVADPSGPAGARMYRTGDVARVGADGALEHLGRSDDQIKVRGQRIELGEVEAALESHPRVRRAVAAAHDGGDGRGTQLVGYVVPMPAHESGGRPGATGSLSLERGLGAAELRSFLLRRLPEGMVPGTVTVIDEVPLTPNGKVDRAALPRPEFRGAAYRPPRSALEEALTDVYADVLATSRVGVDDDFFALGGDSIQSVRIIAGARDRGVTVTVREIFEHRTVAAVAEAVAATRRAADASPAEPDAGDTALDAPARPGAGGLTPADVPLVTVAQDDLDDWAERFPGLSDVWPVPPLPMGLLVHSMMGREAGAGIDTYQVQYLLSLSGPVDPARLRVAAQALLDRHAALRAAYEPGPDGDLVRLVVDGVALPWRRHDLRGLDEPRRDARYARLLADDLTEQLDPGVPPMLRTTLLTLTDDRHELVLTGHHANLDGWCLALLVGDLLHLYAGRGDASALPPPRSYRDYLAWLARQDARSSARVWAEELAGLDGPTLLASGAVSPVDGTDVTDVGRIDVALPAPAARALPRHAAELGVTLNTLVQGAWAVVLSRLTGRRDVVLAAVTAGRPDELPGVESTVGTFISTVPVRVRFTPEDSVARVLTVLQHRQGALLGHHHHGFSEIARAAGLPALCDSLVAFESFPLDRERIAEAGEAAGITVTDIGLHTLSHFPVTVFAYPDGDHLRLRLQYQRRLFGRDEAEKMGALFGRVLRDVAADPRARVRDLA